MKRIVGVHFNNRFSHFFGIAVHSIEVQIKKKLLFLSNLCFTWDLVGDWNKFENSGKVLKISGF